MYNNRHSTELNGTNQMPLYEYFCQPCNGIFEELRPIREATEPVPCPQCFKDAARIMPTSFAAFTYRDGYPRRIPDDGKFYHLGQKVTKLVTSARPNEHPEINKPEPKRRRSKGEKADLRDMRAAAAKGDLVDAYRNPVAPSAVTEMVDTGRVVRKGSPTHAPDHLGS
ncbi:MAG: zinc ribbon domain-containing protein [Dehalococcoidia bacterium]|jgi:putative FmdB family regulatory protein|uniref:FmdB family zinc ribbon protein n=1 Tax=Candidatus Amarobacter glycogenicus TaxID=3140699 RepID=UPI002A109795|nr:zinc ribbon domain-containing protein [Dehalococcoidia bacterium]MBK6561853.1 zinc ribbon domain-containing protein [Dehalococcoidia bacterium]MBK7126827.1 zinc ribbon domain-containing protein [Dehalococcoidia bacterium]MBK7330721.1 zinc ribbon domain-containing protein [Dehalococcoidia bacterium]MBK8558550.1 zinc ribbon domain-containing protein [Dehalococcoidia bacterium]